MTDHRTGTFRRIAVWIASAMLLGLATPALADAVRLRPSARIDELRPITLADVAEIDSPDAQRLGALVVEPDPVKAARGRAWAAVSVEGVQSALRESGLNTARLAVSGSTCFVRFPVQAEAPLPQPEPAAAPVRQAQVIDLTGPSDVRRRVGEVLLRLFNAEPGKLRALFDAADEPLLSLPLEGRRVAVTPLVSASTTRAVLAIRIYEGDELVESRSIGATIEVLRPAVIVASPIRRRAEIRSDSLRQEERWLTPGGPAPVATIEQVVGSLARSRLAEGDVLHAGIIEPGVVIKRGDLVEVLTLSGGLEIKSRARATEDGTTGQRIELRSDNSRKTFRARVHGPGRVVLNMDEAGQASFGDGLAADGEQR